MLILLVALALFAALALRVGVMRAFVFCVIVLCFLVLLGVIRV